MNKKENKKEKSVDICRECNTPLVEPRAGYVVCPNCGLVHYDYRLVNQTQFYTPIKPRKVLANEVKKLKKWDRITYREARENYIRAYLAFFLKYVSKSLHDEIVSQIVREINKRDEKDKTKFRLISRYAEILGNDYSKHALTQVIMKENPEIGKEFELIKKAKSEKERKKRKAKETKADEMIKDLAENERIKTEALVFLKRNDKILKDIKKQATKAFIALVYAEHIVFKSKQSPNAKKYAVKLGISYYNAIASVKKVKNKMKV